MSLHNSEDAKDSIKVEQTCAVDHNGNGRSGYGVSESERLSARFREYV